MDEKRICIRPGVDDDVDEWRMQIAGITLVRLKTDPSVTGFDSLLVGR